MAKRFKILNAALKTLAPSGTAPSGTAPATPPTGSILATYASRYQRNITYPANTNRNRKLNFVGVIPFGADAAAGSTLKVPISSRVVVADRLNPETALAHQGTSATTGTNKLFDPAKVIIFIPAATQTATPKTSEISGRKYNPREGTSYTIPFGNGTTLRTFKEAKEAIATAVLAKNTDATVSFKPEDARYI